MSVGIVIGTFGEREWANRAYRAIESIKRQTVPPDDWVHIHAETLHEARNYGAWSLNKTHTIFLDADDELDEHYVEAMLKGTGDIRRPSTIGIVDGVEDDAPVLIPERPLIDGNYIVIGAMVDTEAFLRSGGFRDEPVLEDWSLWIRMVLGGARVEAVPEAIYRVHVRSDGRNVRDPELHGQWYRKLRDEFAPRWRERARRR